MAVDQMSADAVSDGRLVRPFPMAVESDLGYWLVVAEGRREQPKVKAFREWLRTEVPDSAGGYVAQARQGRLRERSVAGGSVAAQASGG